MRTISKLVTLFGLLAISSLAFASESCIVPGGEQGEFIGLVGKDGSRFHACVASSLIPLIGGHIDDSQSCRNLDSDLSVPNGLVLFTGNDYGFCLDQQKAEFLQGVHLAN